MSAEPPAVVAGAYDAVAADYDRLLGAGADAAIRRQLWRHHDAAFGAGDRVLDAGCGTGIDALHLAARGVHVHAVDVSPKMIAELRAKLARAGGDVAARVDVHVGDVAVVAQGLPGGLHGIVSSFAALNTVDLPAFARAAAALLRPGGRLICHLLAPGYGGRGGGGGGGSVARAVLRVGAQPVEHALAAPGEIFARHFAGAFRLRRCYGMGLLLRPRVARWLPAAALSGLAALETAVASLPLLRDAGRFVVLDLERTAPR